ncbi:MAG: hypothetical protein QOF48_2889 [Verrucomicrobiota bacterium]
MKLKSFQKQDLARLALHDGGILGWDKGLGKTLGMLLWSLLKAGRHPGTVQPLHPCLLVAPGDVHDAVVNEARDKLGIPITPLDSQDTFLRLSTINPEMGARELPSGFYLSSYTQLATNKIADFPEFANHSDEAMMVLLHQTGADVAAFHAERGTIYAKQYAALESNPGMSSRALQRQYSLLMTGAQRNGQQWREIEIENAFSILINFHGEVGDDFYERLPAPKREFVRHCHLVRKHAEFQSGMGEVRPLPPWDPRAEANEGNEIDSSHTSHSLPSVKCIYSPSLADLCRHTFTAIAIDEATKIKGETTLIGAGIRQLSPCFRLVLTGTPIKNRIPDIFRLAHWATGGHADATARWPYASDSSEREAFASEFLVSERNVTKEESSDSNRRYKKLTPQVCNIHRLWKLLGPIVLRRLKKDCGEDLVPKHRHVIRVPMGSEQARVYRHHLEGEYLDCNAKPAMGAQLQALRVAAAAPHSDLLKYTPQPKSAPPLPSRSATSWIPKYATALTLVEQVLARREQIVIFSALLEPLETLSRRLTEAGVPHLVAHGGSSPTKRRKLSAQFKLGPAAGNPWGHSCIPVLLASGECMAEAHSWHLCNNVALLAYSWAYDKLSQAIDRCHRLNSVKALNYHAIVCDGSVDRKLEQNLQEKGDASDLVLDGHLLGENPEELNMADLLAVAAREFNAESKTVDESVLEAEWPFLRERLKHAADQWFHQTKAPIPTNLHRWLHRTRLTAVA